MSMDAARCPNGHITYPPHPRCPECGEEQDTRIDLAERTGTVLTWTVSTASPVGVRSPNALAIVAFDIEGNTVRAVGQLTSEDVAIGDRVEPVYMEALREPGIREPDSQDWDGYRFSPFD